MAALEVSSSQGHGALAPTLYAEIPWYVDHLTCILNRRVAHQNPGCRQDNEEDFRILLAMHGT